MYVTREYAKKKYDMLQTVDIIIIIFFLIAFYTNMVAYLEPGNLDNLLIEKALRYC